MLTRNEVIDLVARPIFWETQEPYTLAEEIISNLEKAGVLMLVDDEPKEGDKLVITGCMGEESLYICHKKTDYELSKAFGKIIQRNDTPAYQCKKRGNK